MPRSRRSGSTSRRRWPLWLVVLAAVAGWYFGKEEIRRDSSPPSVRRTARPPVRATAKPPILPPDSGSPPVQKWEKPGQTFTDVVTRVVDGDTVKLKRNGNVRLIGVDTPESKQPGGKESTEWARRKLEGKTVQVRPCEKQPTDRYGRLLAFVYYRDDNGQLVQFNRELVWRGYARVYSLRPCTVDEDAWQADYEAARAHKRGLFRSIGHVPDAAAYRRKQRTGNTS